MTWFWLRHACAGCWCKEAGQRACYLAARHSPAMKFLAVKDLVMLVLPEFSFPAWKAAQKAVLKPSFRAAFATRTCRQCIHTSIHLLSSKLWSPASSVLSSIEVHAIQRSAACFAYFPQSPWQDCPLSASLPCPWNCPALILQRRLLAAKTCVGLGRKPLLRERSMQQSNSQT